MQLIDSLHPNNVPWFYEHMRKARPIVIVFEINEKTAGLLCGRLSSGEIMVDFEADSRADLGFGYAFSLDGVAKGHNLKMLAWRHWDGAWRVLDCRVSALLGTVDSYVEGD